MSEGKTLARALADALSRFVPPEHDVLDAVDAVIAALGIPASTLAGLRDGSLVAVPRERIEHWLEYWNKDRNETAMADALDFLESEFADLLAAPEPPR